jgi:hypothetical protein
MVVGAGKPARDHCGCRDARSRRYHQLRRDRLSQAVLHPRASGSHAVESVRHPQPGMGWPRIRLHRSPPPVGPAMATAAPLRLTRRTRSPSAGPSAPGWSARTRPGGAPAPRRRRSLGSGRSCAPSHGRLLTGRPYGRPQVGVHVGHYLTVAETSQADSNGDSNGGSQRLPYTSFQWPVTLRWCAPARHPVGLKAEGRRFEPRPDHAFELRRYLVYRPQTGRLTATASSERLAELP